MKINNWRESKDKPVGRQTNKLQNEIIQAHFKNE